MFGIWRRGSAVVVPAVAALVLLTPRPARADDAARETLFGFAGKTPTTAQAKVEPGDAVEQAAPIDWSKPISLDRVWTEDFHPETDRWTERNNRIKISLFGGGWFLSRNLRIENDAFAGLRIAWEVPGFIGIRLDSAIVPGYARLRVRLPSDHDSTRHIQHSFFGCESISVAIFNPELSYPANLAMWAGLGVDLWWYNFVDRGVNSFDQSLRWQSSFGKNFTYDENLGLNFFFDLQYKIADIFHVGIMYRQHILYAPQTELGEFYHINGVTASHNHHGRNNTRPADLAAVEELSLSAAVLF